MPDTLGSESADAAPAAPPAPFLARVIDADAPRGPASWHSLAGIDRVVVRRGPSLAAHRRGRELALEAPDARMSEQHARLDRRGARWELRDLASKNGTRVGGAPIETARLAAGDRFECGRTTFALGEGPARDGPLDRTIAEPLASLSPAFAATLAALERAAPSSVTLVLVGETGTGKEVFARAAHARAGRAGPFVAVNCGALPAALVEDALFGHVRGAFSGAATEHAGALRAAHGGTLLLDELGDLPAPAQAALLRALQEREVVPLGATRPIPIEIRVIAATQRPLAAHVAAGTLRADLAFRLAGLSLALPPLRERLEDLGVLVAALLARSATPPRRFAPDAVRAMFAHAWPGNVRELEKRLEVAALRADGGTIERAHLELDAPALEPAPPPIPLSDDDRATRDALVAALAAHRGNLSSVARALAKDRVQIRRWLARFGLDAERYRK